MTSDEDNEADGLLNCDLCRLLKKLHMQGVEEQGMRRTLFVRLNDSPCSQRRRWTFLSGLSEEQPSSRLRPIPIRLRYAGGHHLAALEDAVFYFSKHAVGSPGMHLHELRLAGFYDIHARLRAL